MRKRLLRLAALLPLVLSVPSAAAWSPADATARQGGHARRATLLPPFFAFGDSAANIPLSSGSRRVLLRWVARRSGELEYLHLQVKVRGRGYADGSGGVLRATTHPVRADGRPNTDVVLADDSFAPRTRERGGSVAVRMGIDVSSGDEFATVIRNDSSTPSTSYFSVNFLYSRDGLLGANRRNERRPAATDRYYGLDARELVGYSTDAGATWLLPGGPYGRHDGKDFLPTYVQHFGDGVADGQYYYYSHPVHGFVRMVYPRAPRTTITHVAAYTSDAGSATVVLAVNGRRRSTVRLRGEGFVKTPIRPVAVPGGATVSLTTMAGPGGLALSQQFADSRWASLVGLGRRHRWYLASDPATAVPLFPLPAWGR